MDGAELQRRFRGYLARLSSGAGHASAWRESFGDIGPEELDRKIRALRAAARGPDPQDPAPPRAGSATSERAHSRGRRGPPSLGEPLRCAEATLVDEEPAPSSSAPRPSAAPGEAPRPPVERPRRRRAAKLGPDEPRILWALAWALTQDRRRGNLRDVEPLVQRLEERAPSPPALNFVAWYWGRASRPDHGLSVARRALQAAPSCWRCAETMAALFFAKGRPREALALQRRALKMLPPHVSASQPLARLRSYERVAGTPETTRR